MRDSLRHGHDRQHVGSCPLHGPMIDSFHARGMDVPRPVGSDAGTAQRSRVLAFQPLRPLVIAPSLRGVSVKVGDQQRAVSG